MGLEEKIDMLRWELAIVVVLLLVLMYRSVMTGCNCSSAHSDMLMPSDMMPSDMMPSGIVEGLLKSPKARTGLGNADKRSSRNPGGSVKRGGSNMYRGRGPRKSGFAAYTINGSSPFSDGIDTTGGTFTNTSMLF
jgi:hypothetical protein